MVGDANTDSIRSRVSAIPTSVWAVALCAMVAAITVHLGVRQQFLDNMDERNYLWLADRILEGRVTSETVPQDLEQHFKVWWRAEHLGRQYTVFPVGWSVLLAVGRALSVPWIVNPILAGATVLLTYMLTHALYADETVAMRTTLLFALSPFLAFQAGTMLSHVATAFWLLLGLLALLWMVKRERSYLALIAGVAIGFAFSTRPLDALTVTAPAVVALIIHDRRRLSVLARRLALLAVGGVVGVLPFVIYNAAVTGAPLLTPQQLYGIPNPLFVGSLADWATKTLPPAINQVISWQTWFLPVWVVIVSYFFLLGRGFNAIDFLCLITIFILLGAYSFNTADFDISGPRFHFCALVPSCILLARVSISFTRREALFGFLAISLYYAVIFGYQGLRMWKDIRAKRSLELCIKASGIDRALIFVADGWHFGILASDLLDNRPDFSGIVYALDIPATNQKVLDYFASLPVYKWPNKSKSPGCLSRWEAPVDGAQ
jgi:hypothetical protein